MRPEEPEGMAYFMGVGLAIALGWLLLVAMVGLAVVIVRAAW